MALKHNDDGGFVPPEPSGSKPDVDPEIEALYAEWRKLPPEIICPWEPSLTREMINEWIANGEYYTFEEVKRFAGMP